MSLIVRNYGLKKIKDITTPTATMDDTYKLGDTCVVYDDEKKVTTTYMYVYATQALDQYGLYMITYGGAAGKEVAATVIPNAAVSAYTKFCSAQVAFTTTYYGWVAIEGSCTLLSTVDATLGKYANTEKNVATCTDTTTRDVYTVGIWKESKTGASSAVASYLIGNRALVYST